MPYAAADDQKLLLDERHILSVDKIVQLSLIDQHQLVRLVALAAEIEVPGGVLIEEGHDPAEGELRHGPVQKIGAHGPRFRGRRAGPGV